MEIHKIKLDNCHHASHFVVVIDVIRAFTTAAFAFARGAEKIILVSHVEDAFTLSKKFPHALMMGEVNGKPVEGFHFSNSPVEIAKQDLTGKTLIFRSSAGTQGVIKSAYADKLLVSSFVVAEATLERIKNIAPSEITFVITSGDSDDEDLSLADYLEAKLTRQDAIRSHIYLERVKSSRLGRLFSQNAVPEFCSTDLEAVLSLDQFDFAMEVIRESNLLILQSVHPSGERWRHV